MVVRVRSFIVALALSSFLSGAFPVSLALAADVKTGQLSKSELEDAQELRAAYVAHLYTSSCYDNGKRRIGIQFKSTGDPAKDLEGVRKACDCMANAAVKEVGAAKVMDYVVFMYGATESKAENSLAKQGKDKVVKPVPDVVHAVDEFVRKAENKKKCGFIN